MAGVDEQWRNETMKVEPAELFQHMVESARDFAIFALDADGRIASWNSGAARIFGYAEEEIIGQPGAILFTPEDREQGAPEQELSTAATEGCSADERWHLRRDGSRFWASGTVRPLDARSKTLRGFVKVARDFTERKLIEEERAHLLEREQSVRAEAEAAAAQLRRLQAITDTALAHLGLEELLRELLARVREVLVGDTAAILLADPQGNELRVRAAIGLEAEVAAGTVVPVGRGIAGRIAASRTPLVVDNLSTVEVVSPLLRSSGVTSLVGAPLLILDRVIGVIHVGTFQPRQFTPEDMRLLQLAADRAALAIDHARLYQEAQEAVRVRHEFLSVATHDLKTPIASMLGYAQLLESRAHANSAVSERDRRALQTITEQGERLNRLVNRLLDFSEIDSGTFTIEREPVELCALAQRVADEMAAVLDQHTLDRTCPDEPLYTIGDAMRLEQVVRNLIGNAIKYSPAGGPIRFSIERQADQAVLSISDSGIGIPHEALARLFQRFYRARNARTQFTGLGLGLYIVKEIVTLHGGVIEVRSEEGQGSTFTVRLPLLDGD